MISRERDPSSPVAEPCVFLVGMMGAGKTTVGRSLADRLGLRFVDTDRAIERSAGASIPEIFEFRGEAAFREIEREVVLDEASRGGVLALGGGAFAQPGAPEALAPHGRSVYLRARVETLVGRTGGAGRPLLAGLSLAERSEKLRGLLAERGPAYDRADWTIDVDELAAGAVALRIAEWFDEQRFAEGARGAPHPSRDGGVTDG